LNEDLYEDVKDADWEPVKREVGEIKFKKVSQGKKVKNFCKTISFILIAVISGGASGAYIVDKKYANKIYPPSYTPIIVNREELTDVETARNVVTQVADIVGPAVVGISNQVEGGLGAKGTESGSGIIFDSKGYIVTNNYVIEGSKKITVKLSNGKAFDAKCIGIDLKTDLAVIKIDADNLPKVRFGDSSRVKVGDVAIAIGNPLGEELTGTVTAGVISSVNKKFKCDGSYYRLLQTDAPINSSNSGGALCNDAGEVIGINSLKFGSANFENVQGIGFALSINEVDQVVKKIMKSVKVKPSVDENSMGNQKIIGIIVEEAVPEYTEGVRGVYVREVVMGSVAAAAGLKPTDIIIEVNNVKVTRIKELDEVVSRNTSKTALSCKVWRNGKILSININLS